MLAALGVVAFWSYGRMAGARARAADAASDTQACEVLQAQIEGLRQRPKLAEEKATEQPKIVGRIQQSADEALIGPGYTASLVRIDPSARPIRLGESAYTEKRVTVSLDQLKLGQLVDFLYPLIADRRGLRTKRIALTAPRTDELGDRWNVELTLGYLIYSPRTPAPGSAPGSAGSTPGNAGGRQGGP
jgi:hypothetical protein